MKKIEYEKMFLLEDSHFWFVGKRFFIKTYLDKIKNNITNILDIGSGTGGTTKLLKNYGNVVGIEKNILAASLARKRGLKIIRGTAEKLPFKKNTFDLITIFDVLYHKDIKNINNVFKEIFRVLKPKGYLLITDSALNLLKGNHSRSTKEERRFTTVELTNILNKNSFVTIQSSYIFSFIFPLILFKRVIFDKFFKSEESDVFLVPKRINLLLIYLLRLESLLLNYVKLPIGSSLIILARKNEK